MDSWHYRSTNGYWSPRRSPIKIKIKVIKKKLKVPPRARKAAWMANHLQAIRKLYPQSKIQDKPMDMVFIARIVKESLKTCPLRSRKIIQRAQIAYRVSLMVEQLKSRAIIEKTKEKISKRRDGQLLGAI